MTYVAWTAVYEGATDAAYFDVLIPRVMEDIIFTHGIGNSDIAESPAVRPQRDTIDAIAKYTCDNKMVVDLVFFHADTGGHGMVDNQVAHATTFCQAIHTLCEWPQKRCIPVMPRHETEAWVLADPMAVTSALGYRGSPESIGLPTNAAAAEQVRDPKAILKAAVAQVRGRRRPVEAEQILPSIAQRQSMPQLRKAQSFTRFEERLKVALSDLGCISLP